ncbi:Transport of quorum-sensing signal protein [Budvicia aquatica]|uniref:Transport of quorum-sensing signal protein n=1 Tax=Budvicia aquatica TaxID=82979 RepID=A0A484ZGF1_9GAMM|nr:Transport of quorum-sensing signal protein [Budvicia aquatica]
MIGNIIEPRIMGAGWPVNADCLLSLIFWGWLLGPVGMLLSVPLTIVAKIMLEANPGSHRLAIMLGDGK